VTQRGRRTKRKYAAEGLWTVASVLVPFGWEFVSGRSALQVVIGWTLWLIPFSLGIHLFWRWATDERWRLRNILVAAILTILCFVYWATASIYSAAHPTFMYFIPGLALSDNLTRSYGQEFYGNEPLFHVQVSIADEDALAVAKKEGNAGNAGASAYYFEHYGAVPIFQSEEADPRHTGFIPWFAYKPFNLNNETLEFGILTREIDISERMQVYQSVAHTLPAYYLNIINARTGKLLKECISDSRYAEHDRSKSKLPLCCDDLDPQEGIYGSCAPWYERIYRSAKGWIYLIWQRFA
jgi:hypothetical protein